MASNAFHFHVVFIEDNGQLTSYDSETFLPIARFLVKKKPKQFRLLFGEMVESLVDLYCTVVSPGENVGELRAIVELEEAANKPLQGQPQEEEQRPEGPKGEE